MIQPYLTDQHVISLVACSLQGGEVRAAGVLLQWGERAEGACVLRTMFDDMTRSRSTTDLCTRMV